ncbi:MAG: YifB family Mg chelatase-like AAA ATPase [Pseudomonadota bacterium]
MVARINTVAFQGVEVSPVDVQVQISNGLPAFTIVGLPDKAVAESKERVRSALHALGIALPAKRLTVNLAPADVHKEGSHYDLPIALGLLAAMDVIPSMEMEDFVVLGELALDAGIRRVTGVLPAAMHAASNDNRLICPADCGGEAAWAGELDILAPLNLLQIINHMKGTQVLSRPEGKLADQEEQRLFPDLSEVKGQETAKRALEIAAAGGHNLLMVGPPGAGKSMLASCMPGILPSLTPREALEVSMIHSIAGNLNEGGLIQERPYRDPHHSASLPALIGGGQKAKPGEVSLAHRGVLFLDELPEFSRNSLEALRQPLETGKAVVARVNRHATYPADFQLIAAMNPCRCGYAGSPGHECRTGHRCLTDYQAKLSGPLLDRIDLQIGLQAVPISDLSAQSGEKSASIATKVQRARDIQMKRFENHEGGILVNAKVSGELLEETMSLSASAKDLLTRAAEQRGLSARRYYRLIRVARTIADLDGDYSAGAPEISEKHVAEALSYKALSIE